MSKYETVIGLEIHVQITSAKSKLFSQAPVSACAAPNTQIALLDIGLPGTLPVLNEFCVEQAVLTGLALGGEINKRSIFERKEYFYADTPLGYQISQQEEPIIRNCRIEIVGDDGKEKNIRIQRIHLEQDAGKNIHDIDHTNSYIDFNRAGVPLMEVVTEPDLCSPAEAASFIKKLIAVLECIGVCDCDMSKGNLRIDANVSVRKHGEPLGVRVEIKNLNSIRFMQMAVNLEVDRHVKTIEAGGKILMQTLLFDPQNMQTRVMRTKEEMDDYRYFEDPDLFPVVISDEFIDSIRKRLPELPEQKKARFMTEFALSAYDAGILTENKEIADFFEESVEKSSVKNAKSIANLLIGEVFSYMNEDGRAISQSGLTTDNMAEIVSNIENENISIGSAKIVIKEIWKNGGEVAKVIESSGLLQVSSEDEIERILLAVLEKEASYVDEYKSGKEKLFGYLVGQSMKAMQGSGNPKVINTVLKKLLGR